MDRFKKIALAYAGPGDRNILLRSAALAKRNEATIGAVSVFDTIPPVATMLLGKKNAEQLIEDRRKALQGAFDTDLGQLGLKKIPLQVRTGTTAIEIIRFVLEERCDLLIKCRDKPVRGEKVSVTDKKLLRKCPAPRLLLKKASKKKFIRILAAVDPDPSQPARLAFHRDIIKLAKSLAAREKSSLDIVHAWDTFATVTLQGPRFNYTENEIKTLAEDEEQMRKTWLEELTEPFISTEVPIQMHLIQGNPAQAILDFSRRRKCDLLVMGTVARTGLPGLLIGNTAEQILDNLNCSTLTIKPNDFVCPIKP